MRRPRRLADLRSEPCCVYCGGKNEQVDHVPAKIIFRDKQRPKGLEVPSCAACNQGMRLSEQVMAVVSRVYPDPPEGDTEFGSLLHAVNNNAPGVLFEMAVPRARQKLALKRLNLDAAGGLMSLSGPQISAHALRFGAKLGFAMHYHETGSAIPPGGGVAVSWFSNVDDLEVRTPDLPPEFVGGVRTLVNGKRHVGDQFQFASGAVPNGAMTMTFASFRYSVAMVIFTAADIRKFAELNVPEAHLFRLGDLQAPVPQPLVLRCFDYWTVRYPKRW